MKLTLAIIAGDIARPMMRRFLEAFRPIYDEVVVVEAIGSGKSSARLVAEAWAKEAGVTIRTGAYLNRPEHADWPHVDDFASARNLAWQIAEENGAEWVMWADTDDIITPDDEIGRAHV